MNRREQLADRLATLQARIERACAQARRDAAEITLIVVTKTFPASDVRLLAELGVRDIGENRDQEASAKAAECAGLDLSWHFVGQLQTNKANSVARYASVVHSVDRPRLVAALSRAAAAAGRELRCLVQLSLDEQQSDQPGRGGIPPAAVLALADQIASAPHLQLTGVMAIAPFGADPVPPFARLAEVSQLLRQHHPAAGWISAGMSEDLEAALHAGATHLRVGTAILGDRPAAG
ncbi:MAG: YggS family pyridoxal phosphate-dependent enzyme [Jiangellaceae bacterium]|nr:YggS family pyridoxal phosphate-dependent enzyme [Jiangellaceae bacterium]